MRKCTLYMNWKLINLGKGLLSAKQRMRIQLALRIPSLKWN